MSSDLFAALVTNPATPPAQLAVVATERPDLRVHVARHPAAYPELLAWLRAQGDPAVVAAVDARTGGTPAAHAQATASSWLPQPGQTWQPSGGAAATPVLGAPATWGPGAPTNGETATVEPYGAAPGRSSRRGLLVGAAVLVVVLGAGGFAAWTLVLSKLGGARTPEAAVTRLLEGAARKDLLQAYGVLAPSEVSLLSGFVEPFAQAQTARTPDLDLAPILDELDVDLEGLRVSSDEVDDGLAKVEVTDGTLTIDGDPEKIVDAVLDVYRTEPASRWADELAEGRDELVEELDARLPWTVDAADLVWRDSEDAEHGAFLMAVREGRRWYVSPMMTLGEYGLVADGRQRGAMPGAAPRLASAADAGDALLAALPSAAAGDLSALADVLPTAERRLVAVYLQPRTQGSGSTLTVDEGGLTTTELDADRVRLQPDGLVLTADGERTRLDGTCVTTLGDGGDEAGRWCFADLASAAELGLDELGVVAVREQGGWRVSALATAADAWATVAANLVRLQDEGKLDDDDWLTGALGGGLLGSPLGELGDLGGQPDEDGDGFPDDWTSSDQGVTDGDGDGGTAAPGRWDDSSGLDLADAYDELYLLVAAVEDADRQGDELTPNALTIGDGGYVLTTSTGRSELGPAADAVTRVGFHPATGAAGSWCVDLAVDGGSVLSYDAATGVTDLVACAP